LIPLKLRRGVGAKETSTKAFSGCNFAFIITRISFGSGVQAFETEERPPVEKEQHMASDDYAVVVGLSRYPGLGNLNGPENDARNFAQWLEDENGGAVPGSQVKLILSSRYRRAKELRRARPQADAVDEAFEEIIDLATLSGGRGGRRLYIW
jgi:hypothetical protein